MISIIIGGLVVAASFYGIAIWRNELIIFAKGALPISFLFAGIVAIIAGISGLLPKKYEKLKVKEKKNDGE